MTKDMTPEEFVEYYGRMIINHGNKRELLSDLDSVIRGQLLKYEMKTWDGSNVKTIELNINKFLAENGLSNGNDNK